MAIKRTLTYGVETIFADDVKVGTFRIREVMGGWNIQNLTNGDWLPLHYTRKGEAVKSCKGGLAVKLATRVTHRFGIGPGPEAVVGPKLSICEKLARELRLHRKIAAQAW
jgi:hypothetical protein